MKPDLLKFEGDYKSKVNIVRVNVRDQNSSDYKEYISLCKSRGVPHLILIDKNRNTVNQHTGAMTEANLIDFVKSYVK